MRNAAGICHYFYTFKSMRKNPNEAELYDECKIRYLSNAVVLRPIWKSADDLYYLL